MSNKVKSPLMKKAPTYSLRASIISILIGLLTGAVVILIVGAFNPLISLKGAWDGIRLVLFGVLSTGRDAAGALTFGFNPTNIGNMLFRATPLILTGVSVAVAFKTGLFNIGAPGQYLAGTTASLFLALSIPSSSVPAMKPIAQSRSKTYIYIPPELLASIRPVTAAKKQITTAQTFRIWATGFFPGFTLERSPDTGTSTSVFWHLVHRPLCGSLCVPHWGQIL